MLRSWMKRSWMKRSVLAALVCISLSASWYATATLLHHWRAQAASPEIAQAQFEKAIAEDHPDQARALADGQVTWSEYRSAMDATVACMRKAGVTVHGPTLTGDGQHLAFETAAEPTLRESQRDGDVELRCTFEHLFAVKSAYERRHPFPAP